MERRIDPPSSIHTLTASRIAKLATQHEVWVLEDPVPVACVFLEPRPQGQPDRLYLSKLAVDPAHQGRGLGGRLIALAEQRARALGLSSLTLGVRVELTENQRLFAAHGFKVTQRTRHPGYDRVTSLSMRKEIAA